MPALAEYIPHRESGEHRYCAGCGTDLASRNDCELCFQCGGTWSDPLTASDVLDEDRWLKGLLVAYLG